MLFMIPDTFSKRKGKALSQASRHLKYRGNRRVNKIRLGFI